MDLYYIPEVGDQLAMLRDEELRHAVKVMRLREESEIQFTDGKGHMYRGVITTITKKQAHVRIIEKHAVEQRMPNILLAVAITKNVKRIEWLVEKCTEIGINRVIPMICARSERVRINVSRLEKIAVSAMKQSQRAHLPKIDPVAPFAEVFAEGAETCRILCHASEESAGLKHNYTPHADVLIVIGPEGDFTPDEIRQAMSKDFQLTHLGDVRLRTETAALVAVATIHFLNQIS